MIKFLLFGLAYAVLCVLGAYTENDKVLALIWPANAFMLGMMIRFPSLARPAGWVACLAGFGLTAWLIGYSPTVAATVVLYNFGSVLFGYTMLSRFARADQVLQRPVSILFLLLGAAMAASFAGLAGPLLFAPGFNDPQPLQALPYWFSLELLNQLALLPMILAWPDRSQWRRHRLSLRELAPLVVLLLSGAVGFLFFGGMAALALPVPALLWCAITYRVFLTAALTFGFCVWALITMTLGYADVSHFNATLVLSASLGAALMSLGPLVVSTTTSTRDEMLEQLRYLAAEREIVANELEHRIKNLFALVNGLIGLSVRDDPDMAPLAATLRGRLGALHDAHDLIRGSAGAATGGTSLQALISQLLKPYENGHAGRIEVSGSDGLADAGVVTALALVFHELATNSTKYGALSAPGGALQVLVNRDAEQICVNWREQADTIRPGLNAANGYGSKLLDLTIKSQLRGEYSRTWTAQGLAIEILLPASIFADLPGETGTGPAA